MLETVGPRWTTRIIIRPGSEDRRAARVSRSSDRGPDVLACQCGNAGAAHHCGKQGPPPASAQGPRGGKRRLTNPRPVVAVRGAFGHLYVIWVRPAAPANCGQDRRRTVADWRFPAPSHGLRGPSPRRVSDAVGSPSALGSSPSHCTGKAARNRATRQVLAVMCLTGLAIVCVTSFAYDPCPVPSSPHSSPARVRANGSPTQRAPVPSPVLPTTPMPTKRNVHIDVPCDARLCCSAAIEVPYSSASLPPIPARPLSEGRATA